MSAASSRPDMEVSLNGEPRRFPAGMTVDALLQGLGISLGRVAVEHNLEILPKNRYAETSLQPGDRLEIVQFVGGG